MTELRGNYAKIAHQLGVEANIEVVLKAISELQDFKNAHLDEPANASFILQMLENPAPPTQAMKDLFAKAKKG